MCRISACRSAAAAEDAVGESPEGATAEVLPILDLLHFVPVIAKVGLVFVLVRIV